MKNKPETLAEKIRYVEQIIDWDKFIVKNDDSEHVDPERVVAYFKQNHSHYRHAYGGKGTMHFVVSKDGVTQSFDNIFYQPDVAVSYAKPGSKVLELGSGQGANLVHLAEEHPDMEFFGVDLVPVTLTTPPPNMTVKKQNFSSMPDFPDSTFDVVYAVETIVHNSKKDKDAIMAEVYRVLKPGGVFVVYDYATYNPFDSYSPELQKAMTAIFLGSAGAQVESLAEWDEHFSGAGFSMIANNDLTDRILPDLKRLHKHFDAVMGHPFRAKIVFRTLPKRYTVNILSGWLAYDSAREHVGNYNEWILKKP